MYPVHLFYFLVVYRSNRKVSQHQITRPTVASFERFNCTTTQLYIFHHGEKSRAH